MKCHCCTYTFNYTPITTIFIGRFLLEKAVHRIWLFDDYISYFNEAAKKIKEENAQLITGKVESLISQLNL